MGKTADEMQRAVDMYQSELVRIQQRAMLAAAGGAGAAGAGGVPPTSIPLPLPPPPPLPAVSGSSSHGSVASGHTSPSSQVKWH